MLLQYLLPPSIRFARLCASKRHTKVYVVRAVSQVLHQFLVYIHQIITTHELCLHQLNSFYAYPMKILVYESVFASYILSNRSQALSNYLLYAYYRVIGVYETIVSLYMLSNRSPSLCLYILHTYLSSHS